MLRARVGTFTEGPMTEIGIRRQVSRSTMADVIRRLLVKGCVQRRRKRKDARTYSVTLTAKGRAIMEQIEPIAKEVK
jgi:DNA-binding MarR family transcriptional regulator